ncbi:MAG: DUF4388 domain-containing protein [bacterium]
MTENLAWMDGFEEKPFPALLMEIKRTGKTGILLAKKGTVEKRIFFQNGEPIASRSNLQKDLLGEILCARGRITRTQLGEAVLDDQKKTGDNFGQILIRKGFLTPKDLYAECKYQFVSILFSLFSRENESYTFQEQEASTLIPRDLPKFHVGFSKLLSEGIRLIRDNDFIDSALGNTAQLANKTSVTIPSEELSFSGEDKTILAQVDGNKTLQEIIDASDLESSMTKRILYALCCLGVVEIQAPAAALEQETGIREYMESQEEIPSMKESSLSSFMDEVLPEDQPEEIPVFEEEKVRSVDYSKIMADDVEEEDESLPERIGGVSEEEIQEFPDQVQPANAEYESEYQEQAPPPMEETEQIPVEDEQTPSEAEEVSFKTDEHPLETGDKEAREVILDVEQEKERAILDEAFTEKKKPASLIRVLLLLGVMVLIGGTALYYAFMGRGFNISDFVERIRKQVTTRDFKSERNQEIVQKLMEKGESPTVSESPAPGTEVKPAEETAPGETPPEKQDTREITGPPAQEQIAAPSTKEEAASQPSMPVPSSPSWNDLYARGLANFKNGNLKNAIKDWADLVRSAPEHSFTIQIEVTSYPDFASRDIQEASNGEKVFILNTLYNDKPAYKVLCGIYKDRAEAEQALKDLSPYLKAQKPALVSIGRIDKKLID